MEQVQISHNKLIREDDRDMSHKLISLHHTRTTRNRGMGSKAILVKHSKTTQNRGMGSKAIFLKHSKTTQNRDIITKAILTHIRARSMVMNPKAISLRHTRTARNRHISRKFILLKPIRNTKIRDTRGKVMHLISIRIIRIRGISSKVIRVLIPHRLMDLPIK
jgi:hypothetical protein